MDLSYRLINIGMGSAMCDLSNGNVMSRGNDLSPELKTTMSRGTATIGEKNFHERIQQATPDIRHSATCVKMKL